MSGKATAPADYRCLIDALSLQHRLGTDNWVIFDCRFDLADVEFGHRAYLDGHVPGALHLDLDADLSGYKNGHNGRHPLPEIETFAATMSRAGVGRQTQVIAYDDACGMFAARLWWMLRWLGHERVAVLDGGLQAWQRAGGALEPTLPAPQAAEFAVHPTPLRVDVAEIAATLGTATLLLCDARSPDRYRGENEHLDPRAGHIPGAYNRFFRDNVDAEGCFRSAESLRADFLRILGPRAPSELVHYCGSGVTACHNLLAMEVAGLPGARLYPGSWSEWCADPARPAEAGACP